MSQQKGRVAFRLARGKQGIYVVEAGGVELGYIERHRQWRRFVFNPLDETIYDARCLRQIADFLEVVTKQPRD